MSSVSGLSVLLVHPVSYGSARSWSVFILTLPLLHNRGCRVGVSYENRICRVVVPSREQGDGLILPCSFGMRLICASVTSIAVACKTMDELEQIKARKIAEMMQEAQKRDRPTERRRPIDLSDGSFESTIQTNKLVVVDCWAAWCYPCRMIAPVIEEMAGEYSSAALFAKLDVDENPLTAEKYHIQSIPTILIVRDGIEVDRIVGAVPRAEIEALLKKHL